jgi:hypothetical protein
MRPFVESAPGMEGRTDWGEQDACVNACFGCAQALKWVQETFYLSPAKYDATMGEIPI